MDPFQASSSSSDDKAAKKQSSFHDLLSGTLGEGPLDEWEAQLEHNPFASPDSSTAPVTSSTDTQVNTAASSSEESVVQSKAGADESLTSVALPKQAVDLEPNHTGIFFQIDVCDPQTAGDGLKAHTVYKIVTKTDSPDFKSHDIVVYRRFKEFLWLYEQLTANNPGRFEEDFVANRRVLLERMLRKCSRHSLLQKDPDFRNFLQSDNLQILIKKETKASSFMSKLNEAVSNATISLIKSAEVDEWFENKRKYFDELDNQLRQISKAIDSMIKHREEMAAAAAEFADAMKLLSSVEINKTIESNISNFADVQLNVKNVYDKQAKTDLFYLANVFDEYNRLMASVTIAFNSRSKAYQNWHNAEQNLVKSKINFEKSKLNPKVKADKVSLLESEILDAESKVVHHKKEFEDISKLFREEIELFEKDKVADIKAAIKGFLSSNADHQREIVSLWETYVKQCDSSVARVS